MTPIRTIRSHAGLARWLAELSEEPIGEIARPDIPSPYHFSHTVNVWDWNGKAVFWRETSHKVYRIYGVPHDVAIHPVGTL